MTAPLQGGSNRSGVRPVWLRPGAVAVVAGLHLSGFLFLAIPRPNLPSAEDPIEITIAQGTPAVEQPPEAPPPPTPEPEPPKPEPPLPLPPPPPEPPEPSPPEEPPQAQPPDPPPPEPPPPVAPEPPKRVAPDAPVIALPPKPPRPKPPPPDAPPPSPNAPGAAEVEDQTTHMRATYAARILQEIRDHRISARGVGSVVVAFSVDAAGDMTGVTIVRSSGKEDLDSTALRMVRAARPGPPPDGRFSGSTTINFVDK